MLSLQGWSPASASSMSVPLRSTMKVYTGKNVSSGIALKKKGKVSISKAYPVST
jgi:hypothetical protein